MCVNRGLMQAVSPGEGGGGEGGGEGPVCGNHE